MICAPTAIFSAKRKGRTQGEEVQFFDLHELVEPSLPLKVMQLWSPCGYRTVPCTHRQAPHGRKLLYGRGCIPR